MRADTPDLDGGIGIAGPRELGDLRRFSHEAMNTVFEVYATHADGQYAAQAAQAAFALVDRLEGELSRFRPNSDISRLNHLTAGESARVGEAATKGDLRGLVRFMLFHERWGSEQTSPFIVGVRRDLAAPAGF